VHKTDQVSKTPFFSTPVRILLYLIDYKYDIKLLNINKAAFDNDLYVTIDLIY
jgi:hypothetical protein